MINQKKQLYMALEKKNPKDKEKDKERDRIKSRREEPTGEAQSLIGRKLHKFGDLAQREKIPQTYLYRRKTKILCIYSS